MPFVNVKIVKDILPEGKKEELIAKLTDAVVSTYAIEKLRPYVWVVLEEVEAEDWGVGGETLTVEGVKAMLNG